MKPSDRNQTADSSPVTPKMVAPWVFKRRNHHVNGATYLVAGNQHLTLAEFRLIENIEQQTEIRSTVINYNAYQRGQSALGIFFGSCAEAFRVNDEGDVAGAASERSDQLPETWMAWNIN